MSTQKIMTAEQIRMELARRQMTKTALAGKIGVSPDYVGKILRDLRKATGRRKQITEYFNQSNKK